MRRGSALSRQDEGQDQQIDAEQHAQRNRPDRQAAAPRTQARIHEPRQGLPLPLDFRFLECVENEGHDGAYSPRGVLGSNKGERGSANAVSSMSWVCTPAFPSTLCRCSRWKFCTAIFNSSSL